MARKSTPAVFSGELPIDAREASPTRSAYRVHTDEKAVTWRFYRGADHRWRWQKTASRRVLAGEYSRSFPSYADCVTDARTAGYTPLLSARNLVPLSLVHNRASNLVPLGDAVLTGGTRKQDRSPVLKKRVLHPAIEGIFGKPRRPVATAPRVSDRPRSRGSH